MNTEYKNPLLERYASKEMSEIFSDQRKFSTWRSLWIALAEAQKELGLNISQLQIDKMKEYQYKINFSDAKKFEKELRHDVMAHVHAFGMQCPEARPIIHLGATSAYVGDNTDIILMREALLLVQKRLVNCMRKLAAFALKYKNMPTLGFTHFQPAQLTTVGKRAALWLQDLAIDIEDLKYLIDNIPFRGVKGTTGTQASFLKLLDGDHNMVAQLDRLVTAKMGFASSFPVTGQTYPRKLDARVLNILSGIAQSCHKFGNDIRLLQHLKEIEEPFEENQIGSSAMAYKRNPMRSERMSSLARMLIAMSVNPQITASQQWFERTLDDSANRRIVIPEAFLTADSILLICKNIAEGLVVNDRVIETHVQSELPFMATENILMEAVKGGGDRQKLHEKIRKYSMQASRRLKEGLNSNLIESIKNDKDFGLTEGDLNSLLEPGRFTGRSAEQVEEYIYGHIQPVLAGYKHIPDTEEGLEV
jgi:adenylosuccinate lyase